MLFLKFLLFVDTLVFAFFTHELWSGVYSPIDLTGLIASTVALTILLIGE
jgi:hypothetical protein